jgi:hypothetical protein
MIRTVWTETFGNNSEKLQNFEFLGHFLMFEVEAQRLKVDAVLWEAH